MAVFRDQCNNTLELAKPPQRIVSLVPSQTELLSDLGLDKEIVGVTRYCVHPTHWAKTKPTVGGTKNFDFDKIDALNPDLIIGNKEENYKEGIERLQQKYPVWMSDIVTFQDALEMINGVGAVTHRLYKSAQIRDSIQQAFATLRKSASHRVLYMIWRKPWMAAATGTFIHTMLEKLGLENCLDAKTRYPELRVEEMSNLRPDFIFLSSEPFPFGEKHIAELAEICPDAKIILVDGEMFSWYGSRLLHAPSYLNSLPLLWV